MKKTLSLLLVLAMVLSSFSFAFAAEAEKTPGEILKDLGVLTGNAKGDLMLEDELSRQDMIVLLSRVLGQEDEAKAFKGEISFTDVNDSFYKPYIAWAEANKLTNGVEEGKFGFGRPVTEQEVATFMLRALGYNDVEFKDVPAKAVELGLVAKDADLTVNCKRARMAEITLAALGTKMNGSEKTLAESLGLELPKPEKLEVVEVKADNLKEIKVVFNKAVDAESATNADNYEFDDAEIVDITYNENMVIILLNETLDNKEDYEITIDGIKDLEKVTKEFTAYDNTIPAVEDVVALGTNAIKVTMSEPIKSVGIGDFKLDGKTIYGSIEQPVVGREIVIKPYKVLDAKEHELSVGKLEDFAGFKSVESKHTFEVVEDKEKPTVVDVKATLESAVITFSEDIDKATVSRYNVYHGAKVYPETATKIAGNKVLLVFTAEKALPVYENTLYVSGFADYSGNKMDAAEVKVKPSVDETRPEVMKAELQKDLKTIEIKFSKSINKKDAEDISNYTVLDEKDNKLTIAEAKVDGRIVELVLGKKLNENKEYTLKVSGIRDNNKYPNVMFAYEGKISVGDVSLPKFEYASGSSKLDTKETNPDKQLYITKAHLFFSKDMDLGTVSNPENYLVKLEDSKGNTRTKLLSDVKGEVDIIKGDGKVVLLNAKTKDKITHVGVLGVKDTTGKKISNYGEMIEIEPKVFKVETATAEAKDTVVVKFSLPIAKAPRGAFSFTGDATVKEVEISGNEVTLTLDKKLPADASEKLKIAENEVVSYDDVKLASTEVDLVDEIAPSIAEVKKSYSAGDDYVVLTVVFDENIAVDSKETAKTDLIVKKLNGDAKVKFDIVDVTGKEMTINVPVKENILPEDADKDTKLDTAFSVEVVKGARFIEDKADTPNAAKAMTVRSEKVEGIVLPRIGKKDALNAKIEEVQKINLDNYTEDSANKVKAALAAAKEVADDEKATQTKVNQALKALEDAVKGLVEKKYEVTFVVKDSENNEVKDATITVGNEKVEGNTIKLVKGVYAYKVVKDGYKEEIGSFEVTGETTVNVTLTAK